MLISPFQKRSPTEKMLEGIFVYVQSFEPAGCEMAYILRERAYGRVIHHH